MILDKTLKNKTNKHHNKSLIFIDALENSIVSLSKNIGKISKSIIKADNLNNRSVYTINNLYEFIVSDSEKLRIEISLSDKLDKIEKKSLIYSLNQELDNIYLLKTPMELMYRNIVEDKFKKEVMRLIEVKLISYDYIKSSVEYKDFNYYANIISWYKISMVSVSNAYLKLNMKIIDSIESENNKNRVEYNYKKCKYKGDSLKSYNLNVSSGGEVFVY